MDNRAQIAQIEFGQLWVLFRASIQFKNRIFVQQQTILWINKGLIKNTFYLPQKVY